MNRLKRFLPLHILRVLYCSMIQSNLNYSLLVWGFDLSRLQKIQKKIIRVITGSRYNEHTEPLFKSLRLIKIDDLFRLNIVKFYYKLIHKKVPAYFYTYSLERQEELHGRVTRFNYLIPRPVTRTHTAQKCLRNFLSVVINALPPNVSSKVNTHSFKGFADYAKNDIISKYSYECTIRNCYICGS